LTQPFDGLDVRRARKVSLPHHLRQHHKVAKVLEPDLVGATSAPVNSEAERLRRLRPPRRHITVSGMGHASPWTGGKDVVHRGVAWQQQRPTCADECAMPWLRRMGGRGGYHQGRLTHTKAPESGPAFILWHVPVTGDSHGSRRVRPVVLGPAEQRAQTMGATLKDQLIQRPRIAGTLQPNSRGTVFVNQDARPAVGQFRRYIR
jgi:hypothetical protein